MKEILKWGAIGLVVLLLVRWLGGFFASGTASLQAAMTPGSGPTFAAPYGPGIVDFEPGMIYPQTIYYGRPYRWQRRGRR